MCIFNKVSRHAPKQQFFVTSTTGRCSASISAASLAGWLAGWLHGNAENVSSQLKLMMTLKAKVKMLICMKHASENGVCGRGSHPSEQGFSERPERIYSPYNCYGKTIVYGSMGHAADRIMEILI